MYAWGNGVARDPAAASQYGCSKRCREGDERAYKAMTTNSQPWNKDFRIELQQRLKEAGVFDGPIDDEFGASTQRALTTLKQRAK